MKKIKLDKSEKDILAAYESGELKSVMTPARKKQIKEVAENTLKKDKHINIRSVKNRPCVAVEKI